MSQQFPEVERFELEEGLPYDFTLGRRGFLKMFGGGVAVVCLAPPVDAAAIAHKGADPQGRGEEQGVESWLEIHADGKATVYSGKVEIGQGARTTLRAAVAEELRMAPEQIEVVLGDTDLVPYDMGTWGSMTVPRMVPQVRAAAAAARSMLLDLAASHWNCDRSELSAQNGAIHRGAESAGYGTLAADQKLVGAIPADAPTTAVEDWQVLGKSAAKAEGLDVVTGKTLYVSDLRLPGMLHGRALRPPTAGAVLRSVETSEAEAMEGVTVVHDGDFAGVCAPNARLAEQALRKLRPVWKEVEEHVADGDLWDHLRETAVKSGGRGRRGPMKRTEGDPDTALADSESTIKSSYTADFIAHAPMETRCAVAQWREDGGLNVWTSTQSPFGVRGALSRGLRIPADKVRVRMTAAGGGFGGKGSTPEAPLEAARLSKAAGAPVKVIWTREEEFRFAYFRPAALIDVEAGVRRDGKLTAWRFHDYNAGTSSIDTPYRVADKEIAYFPCSSPLKQGSYRALAATANNFAREMVMDELAETVEMDPLELRLANLDVPRLRDVLLKAADAFGWHDREDRPGRGHGIACGIDKGSWVATCAEVALDSPDAAPRVLRITTAFDCGAILDPANLEHQVVGAAIQGIGGALWESIGFSGGRIRNPRFSSYRVPRFRDLPKIEFVTVNRPDQPSLGAGETPIVAIAPAIGAAIRAAGGPRHRALPMT